MNVVFLLDCFVCEPENISFGVLYFNDFFGVLLHWSTACWNANVYNSMSIASGHLAWALRREVLVVLTRVWMYLSAMPFW